ncbi:hypothetical protein L3049_18140 [Labilibaculum sp. DW002]|uniref:DUF4421 domain-containing protein n=1 Tax=Paralabilibaculum antarcticum TaxID=2912572 RepID=A0ABT5VWW4_9BACT|nr:hypothetical protein [Labilibaculum sp. DW002]MDE5419914.1 hypothetical protein [Labilibaculum sp. DW002]
MRAIITVLLIFCIGHIKAQQSGKISLQSTQSTENIRYSQPGDQRVNYYSAWTERGAKVVPYGEIHLSALAVSRYGNYPKTEINSQLLLFPFAPNVGFKHEWLGENTILSTQHTVYYPSLGLKWARNSGFKDQIPESATIPHIFTFRNELIVSRILNPQPKDCFVKIPELILTGRLGFDFSLSSGDSQLPLLDYHFLYHRTASYHKSQKLYFMGLELAGNAYKNFNFSINADYYSINFNGEWAMESQGKIHWHRDSRFSVSGGYKLAYVNTDFGTQFVTMPVIDLVFKLRHQSRLQNGLFKK